MQLIVLSYPDMLADEDKLILSLFEAGMVSFHLRKPVVSYEALEELIQRIPVAFRSKVVLHQHYTLAFQYGLQGIHLPEQVRKDMDTSFWLKTLQKIDQGSMTISTAIHTKHALREIPPLFDYVLMSPVFSSISKPGHAPQEDMDIRHVHHTHQVFALGGVDATNISQLAHMGYQGAAILGGIWQSPASAVDNFIDIQKAIHQHSR